MNIHRLAIPTPFPIGDLNAYLIDGPPLTLIDCGPRTEQAWAALCRGIESAGHRIEQIERLLLTHNHVDHAGLAARVQRISGCEVLAYREDIRRLRLEPGQWRSMVDFRVETCRRAGVPNDILALLDQTLSALLIYQEKIERPIAVTDGDVAEFEDGRLEILNTPGHATGCLSYWHPEEAVLFVGDTVLGHLASNAFLEPGNSKSFRRESFLEYLSSLERLRRLSPRKVLPGHGKPIFDLAVIIEERLEGYEQFARRVLRLVQDGAERPWDLARHLYPGQDPGWVFLGVSSVVGYLDLLARQGFVIGPLQDGDWFVRATRAADHFQFPLIRNGRELQ